MAATAPHPTDVPPAAESPRRLGREVALIGVLSLVLNLAGNGRISLWDRDEPRYATCTREMRTSGDYLHPTFNAEPRYHKPILIYWLMLAGTALGGDNEFGARLVSALAGTGTVLAVWALGRRMLGPAAGRLAALMLASAPMMVAESKMATTDATLLFFLVLCQFALWELSRGPSRRWATTFWVALALATLTKGPVGAAVLAVSAALSWWWGGPTAYLRRLEWIRGLSLFALIAAPWFIAIGIVSHGDFYRISMGYHVIRRMTTGIETHGGFPGYYAVLSLATFYPWSALMPAALLGAWARRRADPAFGFLLGWVLGPLLMFEAVQTKIIHYYLPAYPAWALLAAWLVRTVAAEEVNLRRWPLGRLALGLLAGVGIGTTVLLLAGAMVLPSGVRWPCVAMAVVMGPATLYAMERFQAGATERAALGLVGSWSALLLMAFGWLLPAADAYRLAPQVGRHLAEIADRDAAAPMLAGCKPPGIIYYLGRPAAELAGREDLRGRLRDGGAVVMAVRREELAHLRREPGLAIEVRDAVRGLNVENFRNEDLRMIVIRAADGRPGSGLAGMPKEPLVK